MRADKPCYALESELVDPEGDDSDEFATGPLADWVAQAKAQGRRQAVPQYLLRLERLSRVALPAAVRIDALRLLLRPTLALARGLPELSQAAEAPALSIRQRLYCLLVKNLKQGLRDLDGCEAAFEARSNADRRWLVEQLFRLLGRQIEYGAQSDRPLPDGTWRELHDLDTYWQGRAALAAVSDLDPSSADDDPHQVYLRLLLLGLAQRLSGDAQVASRIQGKLPLWASQSRLADPAAYVGEIRPIIVEIALDEAPRQAPGLLAAPFHGFVLVPPADFLAEVQPPAGFGMIEASPWPALIAPLPASR